MTLRYKGKLHHIGIGCPYAGWRVILLVAGLDVRRSWASTARHYGT